MKRPEAAAGTVALRHADGLLVRRTSFSVVVLGSDPTASVLEGTAAETWEAFAEPRRLDEVVDLLASRYGVAPADISADLARFTGEMLAAGLLAPALPAGKGG